MNKGEIDILLQSLEGSVQRVFLRFCVQLDNKGHPFCWADPCLLKVPLSNNGFHIFGDYIFSDFPIPFSLVFSFLFCIQQLHLMQSSC